jgi:hypothetical protein
MGSPVSDVAGTLRDLSLSRPTSDGTTSPKQPMRSLRPSSVASSEVSATTATSSAHGQADEKLEGVPIVPVVLVRTGTVHSARTDTDETAIDAEEDL